MSRVKLDRLTPSCLANAANGTPPLPTSAATTRPERGAAARHERSVFGAGASFVLITANWAAAGREPARKIALVPSAVDQITERVSDRAGNQHGGERLFGSILTDVLS
jgi:hypothetical protein